MFFCIVNFEGVPLEEQDPYVLANMRCISNNAHTNRFTTQTELWASHWKGVQVRVRKHEFAMSD